MTRDEICELAFQCRVWIPLASGPEREQTIDRLLRLVALVASAEREACAKVCDTMSSSDFLPHQCAAAIRARGKPDAA